MKKFIYIIVIIICLFSCSKKSKQTNTIAVKNIDTYDMLFVEMKFDELVMFPKGCKVIDSVLIVFEPKLNDGFLSFYSLNSKKLIKRFGVIGDGPCDFINPRFFQNYNFSDDEKSFLLGDTKYLYKLSLDSILLGYSNCENSIIKFIPFDAKGYNYVLHFSDSNLVVNVTGINQIEEFNQSITEKKSRKYYNKIRGLNISDFVYSTQVYDGYYASYNDKTIIAYKNFKQIDLIYSDGKIKNLRFPNFDSNVDKINKVNEKNVSFADNSLYFYSYVFTTSDYFFALCWNASRKEIKENKTHPEIHIFDWDGKLISILKPNIAISYFCVDMENSKIFAIGVTPDDEFGIYTCDMPL